jgi:glutathione-specific gamma-glutamylcyclotransferase
MTPGGTEARGPLPYIPLSAAALEASQADALRAWNGHDPVWVFAYASLIWQPELLYEQRIAARVHGYHRRLCLWSVEYRGTPARPGLVAGLDRGGSCYGVAYRISGPAVADEFATLWRREMSLGQYEARWLECRRLDTGTPIRALAFVIRRDAPNYCGRIGETELVDVLLSAAGARGTNLDYLEQTVAALRVEGLADPHLERLAARARATVAASS